MVSVTNHFSPTLACLQQDQTITILLSLLINPWALNALPGITLMARVAVTKKEWGFFHSHMPNQGPSTQFYGHAYDCCQSEIHDTSEMSWNGMSQHE